MLPLFEPDPGSPTDAAALVEVAVDTPAGPGPRTYTYAVPPELAPLQPGEAVLVPFGRGDRGARQAIGIIMGPGSAPERADIRAVAARIRSDGPLLPPLSLALAGWIAAHYLAPLAVVIRAMLPPGLLEKVELVAEVTPAGETRLALPEPSLPPVELDLLDELAGRARLVRDLGAGCGRWRSRGWSS
jgi:primosomal protein N'